MVDGQWKIFLVNSYYNIGYKVFGLAEGWAFQARMLKFSTKV